MFWLPPRMEASRTVNRYTTKKKTEYHIQQLTKYITYIGQVQTYWSISPSVIQT